MAEGDQLRRVTTNPGRLSAEEIAGRGFASAFRGISETEVRNFLRRTADEFTALSERDRELTARIADLETELATPPQLTEEQLFDALGRETTKVLRSAQEAASEIRAHALTSATELTDEAEAHARGVREQVDKLAQERRDESESAAAERARASIEAADAAHADAARAAAETEEHAAEAAEAEMERARVSGRAMVEEARRVREQVLSDLARRRALMEAQLDELRTGRDQLIGAYRVVKETLASATTALAEVQTRAHAADGVVIEPIPEVPGVDADTEAALEVATAAEMVVEPETEPETVEAAKTEPAGLETGGDREAPAASSANAVDALFARLKENQADSPAHEPAEEPEPASQPVAQEITAGQDNASADASDDSADDGPTIDLAGAESVAADEPTVKPASKRKRSRARSVPPSAPSEPPEIAARDAAMAKVRTALARRAKRALQDEQNDVLDVLRRHKGAMTAAALLPSLESRAEVWAAVLEPAIEEIYRAGGRSVTGSGTRASLKLPRPVLLELAVDFATPLRERVASALSDSEDDDVAQRIGARYREWRNQQLTDALGDVLSAAWVRGSIEAAPADARLSWTTPIGGCCPDCDDDALEPTSRGEPFPTGKLAPPAHSGCRCVLGVAPLEATTAGPS